MLGILGTGCAPVPSSPPATGTTGERPFSPEGPVVALGTGSLSTTQAAGGRLVEETTVVYQCRRLLLYASGIQCVDGTGAVSKSTPWTTIRAEATGTPYQLVVFWLWERETPRDPEGPVITLGAGVLSVSRMAGGKLVAGSSARHPCTSFTLRAAGIRCLGAGGTVTKEAAWTTVRRGAAGAENEVVSFWLWAPGAAPRAIIGLHTD